MMGDCGGVLWDGGGRLGAGDGIVMRDVDGVTNGERAGSSITHTLFSSLVLCVSSVIFHPLSWFLFCPSLSRTHPFPFSLQPLLHPHLLFIQYPCTSHSLSSAPFSVLSKASLTHSFSFSPLIPLPLVFLHTCHICIFIYLYTAMRLRNPKYEILYNYDVRHVYVWIS